MGEGKIIDDRKTNIDSCNSPVGESFCLVFIQTAGGWGPSLRQRWFPGRALRDGRRVPTTSLTVLTVAHWLDVASSLKQDTLSAVQAGVWGCRAQGAGKCVCQTRGQRDVRGGGGGGGWWASFTQALSYLHSLKVSFMCVVVELLVFGRSIRLPFVLSSCSANLRTGVHKQWVFCQYKQISLKWFPQKSLWPYKGVGKDNCVSWSLFWLSMITKLQVSSPRICSSPSLTLPLSFRSWKKSV